MSSYEAIPDASGTLNPGPGSTLRLVTEAMTEPVPDAGPGIRSTASPTSVGANGPRDRSPATRRPRDSLTSSCAARERLRVQSQRNGFGAGAAA